MRIKSIVLLLTLALVFISLAGCGNDIISFRDPVEKRKEAISNFIAGNVAAEAGETYKTEWFEFTIHSIDKVDSYAGHKAEKGYRLYKVLISEKNIRDESIPMGIFDFYMDAPAFEEYIWAIPPLDDTMMPEEFDLEPDEAVQYVMVFEVPTNTAKLALVYTENYEDGEDGATFSIAVN